MFRSYLYLDILFSRGHIVVIETGSEEVDDLYDAEQTESHGHSKQASEVGSEVDDVVELLPLIGHEVQLVKVDVQHCQIVIDVGVVLKLGVGI